MSSWISFLGFQEIHPSSTIFLQGTTVIHYLSTFYLTLRRWHDINIMQYCKMQISLLISCYTGSLRWTGIPGKLFSRACSCWMQLFPVSTFPCSCIRCVPCQMDPEWVRTSMGMNYWLTNIASWLSPLCGCKLISRVTCIYLFAESNSGALYKIQSFRAQDCCSCTARSAT